MSPTVSKKPENFNRRIVISTISVLYLLCFFDFIVQWYYLTWTIVINGDTRESIFLGTVDGPQWTSVLSAFLENSLLIVSDGLLIWRCYHVWGQSSWATSVPLILLVAEFGLFVVTTVLSAKLGLITSDANIILFNNISSALTFVSLGTTLITTFLIGYRMHSAFQIHGLPSRRVFNRIMTIIIESGAADLLVLLLKAIIIVVPSFNMLKSPLSEADYYTESIIIVVSGLAPTVLVTRISLTDTTNTVVPATITHVSGLQFGSQQGSGSGCSGNITGRDVSASADTDDAEQTPKIELKRESSTDASSGDNQV
ncbi:hypothetical protein CVT25_006682 [Psilocybe cyanescens]|uniref:Uncharacterized protein n=1 Tax=Psilocybe cyanescens TaxID=93625 RepID=A0A409XIN3_PSICY|nr:hypothetical protein CVT25_006682 [Psilocybe cyanescens]